MWNSCYTYKPSLNSDPKYLEMLVGQRWGERVIPKLETMEAEAKTPWGFLCFQDHVGETPCYGNSMQQSARRWRCGAAARLGRITTYRLLLLLWCIISFKLPQTVPRPCGLHLSWQSSHTHFPKQFSSAHAGLPQGLFVFCPSFTFLHHCT